MKERKRIIDISKAVKKLTVAVDEETTSAAKEKKRKRKCTGQCKDM